jgi:hypothetical protein
VLPGTDLEAQVLGTQGLMSVPVKINFF